MQKTIHSEDEKYTLEKAINACQIYKASVAHQRAFQNIAHHEVLGSIDEMQRGYQSLTNCYQCGESRHRTNQGCPAKVAICHKCGGKNQ